MSGLIGVIIWIAIVYYIMKKATKNDAAKKNQTNINGQPLNRQSQTFEKVGSLVKENVAKFEKQAAQWVEIASAQSSQGTNTASNATRQQTTTYRASSGDSGQRAADRNRSTQAYQQTIRSAAAYGAAPSPKGQPYRATKEPTPDIVQRAKSNTKKYEADETLHELESEHKHSEKVSSAEAAYVAKDRAEHLKMHMEPTPSVEDENLLGSIEDLMVKGYDGNLSFERDFLGEAMDMINRFTLAD